MLAHKIDAFLFAILRKLFQIGDVFKIFANAHF